MMKELRGGEELDIEELEFFDVKGYRSDYGESRRDGSWRDRDSGGSRSRDRDRDRDRSSRDRDRENRKTSSKDKHKSIGTRIKDTWNSIKEKFTNPKTEKPSSGSKKTSHESKTRSIEDEFDANLGWHKNGENWEYWERLPESVITYDPKTDTTTVTHEEVNRKKNNQKEIFERSRGNRDDHGTKDHLSKSADSAKKSVNDSIQAGSKLFEDAKKEIYDACKISLSESKEVTLDLEVAKVTLSVKQNAELKGTNGDKPVSGAAEINKGNVDKSINIGNGDSSMSITGKETVASKAYKITEDLTVTVSGKKNTIGIEAENTSTGTVCAAELEVDKDKMKTSLAVGATISAIALATNPAVQAFLRTPAGQKALASTAALAMTFVDDLSKGPKSSGTSKSSTRNSNLIKQHEISYKPDKVSGGTTKDSSKQNTRNRRTISRSGRRRPSSRGRCGQGGW